MKAQYEQAIARIEAREGDAPEFLQAVREVGDSLLPIFEKDAFYLQAFETLVEPERTLSFRVPWENDEGKIVVNRGFRIQYSSVIGPYKGGLRFHPTVNQSILKFLGFEQVFKNSLTTLPMGGAKGGSDFDPKGKTDNEVRRFCVSFMTELAKHIGPDTDVPAGDIGVGGREISYLNGQYKRLANASHCVLTGKDAKWGGSLIRPEATGYGAVYFAENVMEAKGESLKGKNCVVSGAGNVALYCVEKLLDIGAKPVTLCDSTGSIYVKDGISREMLAELMELKTVQRKRLSDYKSPSVQYFDGKSVWDIVGDEIKCDAAFPCASQNEINLTQAANLKTAGCLIVSEGANMPSTAEACHQYVKDGIVHCPGKAANAGGVSVSGLEMSQNAMRLSWTRAEVDGKLKDIMKSIYTACTTNGALYGSGPFDLVTGANIAGFLKVADSMREFGWA